MSYVDNLIAAYRQMVSLPWQRHPALGQQIWMAVYPPDQERRLRRSVPAFGETTIRSGHSWGTIDITNYFDHWLAQHEYRESYFREPELLETALPSFLKSATERLRSELDAAQDENGVVGLLGVGSLFGLGEEIKVSALLNSISANVGGRLLVFFPGEHEGDTYRLLDARDGWNYMAIPLTVETSA